MKGFLYLDGDWIGSLVWVYDLITCLFSFLEVCALVGSPATDCLHTLYADSRTAFSFIEPVD